MAHKLEIDLTDWMLILCSDMGTDDERIRKGGTDQISEMEGGRIHCLIIPAELHDVEIEALDRW